MNLIGAGRAIMLAEPPLYKPHLWFVLTDPEGASQRVVAVMLRTMTKFTDPTVVLQRGEHAFIRHDSSVQFSTARWFEIGALTRAIALGKAHLMTDMDPRLLERVRQGLLASPFTVQAIRGYCEPRFPATPSAP